MAVLSITVPDDADEQALKLIINDALSEFIIRRSPVRVYLVERYSPEYLAQNPTKQQQILRRCELAEQMGCADKEVYRT